jgi:hypothetical protein
MNLIERMYTLVEEIRDGRTHARFCQMQKKEAKTAAEKWEWTVRAGETDDDVDTLVREFRATDRHCEFVLKDIDIPEARLSAQVKDAQERIAKRSVA